MRAFIATIGNRDLRVDDPACTEPGPRTASQRGQTMRAFGAEMDKRYEELRERLEAPLLTPALDYLERNDLRPDRVVLIVSNQVKKSVKKVEHWQSDTCVAGKVLKRYIEERRSIPTSFAYLRRNPSIPDEVMSQAAEWAIRWDRRFERIHLFVTGGTPAMTTGILLAALEYCPKKVTPLYMPEGGEVRPLDVGRRLLVGQLRRNLWQAIDVGRFGAAALLVPDDPSELGMQRNSCIALRAILESADHRLSFRLDRAHDSLRMAATQPQLPESAYAHVRALQDSLPTSNNEAGLLAELYHNSVYHLNHEEYADFVLRAINFQQAAVRCALDRAAVGVRYNPDGQAFDRAWLRSEGLANTEANLGGILNYARLTYVANHFAASVPWLTDVLRPADRLQALNHLRNRSYVAHHFECVRKSDLLKGFADLDDLCMAMRSLYREATGRDVGPDPFELTSKACQFLL